MKRSIYPALGFGIGFVLLGLTVAGRASPPPQATQLRTHTAPVVPDCPQVSLDEAVAAADFPVRFPDDPNANKSNLVATHWCDPSTVYFVFDNGVRVTNAFDQIKDPETVLPKLAEQAGGRMARVQGRSAAVNGKWGLEFVVDNVLVAVEGNGKLTESELVAIADTLVVVADPAAEG
jgi:hypothetical protein